MSTISFNDLARVKIPLLPSRNWTPKSPQKPIMISLGDLVEGINSGSLVGIPQNLQDNIRQAALLMEKDLDYKKTINNIIEENRFVMDKPELKEPALKQAKELSPVLQPCLVEPCRKAGNYKANSFIQFDFDHIAENDMEFYTEALRDKGVIFCQKSISGQGLWALALRPPFVTDENYNFYQNKIARWLLPELAAADDMARAKSYDGPKIEYHIDPTVKDLGRLRFFSTFHIYLGHNIRPLEYEPPAHLEGVSKVEQYPKSIQRKVKKSTAPAPYLSLETELVLDALAPYLVTDENGKPVFMDKQHGDGTPGKAVAFKECPFAHSHTDKENKVTESVLFIEPRLAFYCFHAHCSEKKLDDVLARYGLTDLRLDKDKNHLLKPTPRNLQIALARLGDDLQLVTDTFTKSEGIKKGYKVAQITEREIAEIIERLRTMGFNDSLAISSKELNANIKSSCQLKEFDSVEALFNERLPKWDKVPRIEHFLENYLTPDCPTGLEAIQKDYLRAVSCYFVYGAFCRWYKPQEFLLDSILVLIGKEGTRKSYFAKNFCPAPEFFSDNPKTSAFYHDDIERTRACIGKLVIEYAELAGKSKADMDKVKQTIPSTMLRCRPLWCNNELAIIKRFIAIGTANLDERLTDMERIIPDDRAGNRRFLPLLINKPINGNKVADDFWQIMAEAKENIEAGTIPDCIIINKKFGIQFKDNLKKPIIARYIQRFVFKSDMEQSAFDFLEEHKEEEIRIGHAVAVLQNEYGHSTEPKRALEMALVKVARKEFKMEKKQVRAAGERYYVLYKPEKNPVLQFAKAE